MAKKNEVLVSNDSKYCKLELVVNKKSFVAEFNKKELGDLIESLMDASSQLS